MDRHKLEQLIEEFEEAKQAWQVAQAATEDTRHAAIAEGLDNQAAWNETLNATPPTDWHIHGEMAAVEAQHAAASQAYRATTAALRQYGAETGIQGLIEDYLAGRLSKRALLAEV